MEIRDIEGIIEGILFAAGEPVSADRIAAVIGGDSQTVMNIAESLADKLAKEKRGLRIVRLEGALQMCSAPEYADYIRLALETRKPPQLSQVAMEVLAIVAYYQPVTRTYIEQVRGVDSSYTVGLLQERGLIEPCGKLDVPGRPTLFRTTPAFLRTFAISSLDQLPPLPENEEATDEEYILKSTIELLRGAESQNEAGDTPDQAVEAGNEAAEE